VQGPVIIHGPTHVDYDEDIGAIMLSDWFHDDYLAIIRQVMGPSNNTDGYRPYSVSNLINGKGENAALN
jgi:Multicopper oxidase